MNRGGENIQKKEFIRQINELVPRPDPVTTEALKYGKRVLVVGLKCIHMWRTPEGLELVGPRYFGIDADYVPLEELVKGGAANV